MLTILLVESVSEPLDIFADRLLEEDVKLIRVNTGKAALTLMEKETIDLVVTEEKVTDMSGLKLIETLVHTHPNINCAVTSGLSEKDFHAASEGLGILAQLPVNPAGIDAEVILKRLKNITEISKF